MYTWYLSSRKVPLQLVSFSETVNFATDFREVLKYQISWISVQW